MKLELADGLGERAALMVRHRVDEVTDRVLQLAREAAPAANVWITAHDERVRPTHVEADAQTIPANLRFLLRKPSTTSTEQARAPRDPALSLGNRINCRCIDVPVPGAVAASFRRTDVEVAGARTSAQVYSEFPRVVESEFPGQGDEGGGWLARVRDEVAAELRTRTR